MKKLLVFFLALLTFSCSQNNSGDNSLINQAPDKTEYLVSSPDLNNFLKELEKNKLLTDSDFGVKSKLINTFSYFRNLNISSSSLLSIWNITEKSPEYLLITKQDSTLINLENERNKSVETIHSEGFSYKKYQLTDATFFMYENKNWTYISNRPSILREAVQNEKSSENSSLNKAYEATDPSKTSLIFKNSSSADLIKPYFSKFGFSNTNNIGSWFALDLDLTENAISLNGISLNSNGGNINKIPVRNNECLQIVPDNFISFYSFGFDYAISNNEKDSIAYPEILKNTLEIARIQTVSGDALVLNISEAETAREDMAGNGEITGTYRELDLFKLTNTKLFEKALQPFLKKQPYNFYVFLDHFVIFSTNEEVLKELINAKQNSSILVEKNNFKELSASISSQSSLLFLANSEKFQQKFQKEKDNKTNFAFSKNALTAVQIINDKNFAHIHSIARNGFSMASNTEEVSQSLVIKTESPIIGRPFFFKNHLTDQMDLAFQDEANNLYLYSNKGNLHWKKKLDSPVNGEIFQVDLFKNGYQQLAFSTAFQLNVLDRNGNKVKPFPIKFNDQLTQPLSVFDYDSNRNYRFVMVQGKNLFMVGPHGKGIKGFDFEKAKSEIILPPKHIRLNTKDYILVAEQSGKLNILSRQGNIRVPIKKSFNFSDNQWYGYENDFISSNKDHLIKIDQNGNVKEEAKLAENNKLVAEDNTLVYLNENELHINEKTIELDFGLYTAPQILKVKRKNFVAITDTQTQKVFVFKTDGALLEGFPVYGTSQVDIANADTDDRLELLVKGGENEVIVYDFL